MSFLLQKTQFRDWEALHQPNNDFIHYHLHLSMKDFHHDLHLYSNYMYVENGNQSQFTILQRANCCDLNCKYICHGMHESCQGSHAGVC